MLSPNVRNVTSEAAASTSQAKVTPLISDESRKPEQPQTAQFKAEIEVVDPDAAKRETSQRQMSQQQKSEEFFLTGVNVQNQDIQPYAIEAEQQVEPSPRSERIDTKDLLIDQEINASIVDQYKMVAVVDSGRSFCNNEVSQMNSRFVHPKA